MKLIDISGQKFGRLTVLHKLPPRDNGGSNWLCRCECGAEFTAIGSNIRKGDTRSCGCLAAEWSKHLGSNKEFISKRAAAVTLHGHKRRGGMTAEYRTWLGIKRRCHDVGYKDYANWGGRGIAVCERWDESFECFLADMGPRPPGHSIDRINPQGDYSPENCRWATAQQQGETKRSNIAVTVNGVSFPTLASACRHFGVGTTVANFRIKAGIDVATAVSHTGRLPPRRSKESYLPKAKRLA